METVVNAVKLNLVAEVALVYKNCVKPADMPVVKSPSAAYELLLSSWDQYRIEYLEQFKIILLNRANRVLGIYEVSTGGMTSTVVDPRLVFTAALKLNATTLILAHNHPSGNLKPSPADEHLTRKLVAGGRLLDIDVRDHIILTPDGYFSFSDEGLM